MLPCWPLRSLDVGRSDAKIISRPSGDQTGHQSAAALDVSRTRLPAARSVSQTSRLPLSLSGMASNARFPSAAIRSCPNEPFCDARALAVSRFAPLRSNQEKCEFWSPAFSYARTVPSADTANVGSTLGSLCWMSPATATGSPDNTSVFGSNRCAMSVASRTQSR